MAEATPGLGPAARPQLPAGCSGEAAFTHLLRASAERLHETARAFLAQNDPEPVHQLRVALRRHRCLLKAFDPYLDREFVESQGARAQDIARRLSPVRELDVLAGETLPNLAAEFRREAEGEANARRVGAAHKIADGFDALAKKLSSDAKRKRAALRRSDLGVEFGVLVLDLSKALADDSWRASAESRGKKAAQQGVKLLQGEATKLVGPMLDRALKKMRLYGARIDDLTIEERHELRKKAKTLRYGVEFFGSLYDPAAVKDYRRALKQLQKSFGALNDAADALSLAQLQVEPALRPAIKAAVARSEEKMRAEFLIAAERWRDFEETARFWK